MIDYIAVMLRRLLACLLILCLAAPALAVPQHHAEPAQPCAAKVMSHHGHHQPEAPTQKQTGAVPHDCIGCIASYSDGLRLGAQSFVFATEPVAAIADQLSGFAVQPALPPPRA
ncbi:MAG: hypothetical protein ACKOUT_13245 [Novosphingobium sp.]